MDTAELWPWLVLAGLGALHGLNPANGWMFVAARGVQAGGRSAPLLRALGPVAAGHAASVAMVAGAWAQGLSIDRRGCQGLAGALLLAVAARRGWRGSTGCVPPGRIGSVRLALWSFLMATAHGVGLMLVPALWPVCLADNPARAVGAAGSPAWALWAVVVHTAAMLAVTGVIAAGVCRGLVAHPGLRVGTRARHGWTAVLATSGLLLLAGR